MKHYIFILLFILFNTSFALAESKHQFIDALIKLDLSDEQKGEIATILKSARGEVRPKIDQVVEARKKLISTIRQENFDEDAVRTASKELAKVQEDLAVLRAKNANKVMKVLKPEQREVLKEMREDMTGKARHKFAGLRKLLNYWIDKHAKG